MRERPRPRIDAPYYAIPARAAETVRGKDGTRGRIRTCDTHLAQGAGGVAVCDADGAAVVCGRATAREAGERRIRFHRADALRFLDESQRRKAGCDLLVANPPRTGLGPGVAAGILALQPSRIVMVSCNPATLARDLRALIRGGCRLDRVIPVDMFPQTAHVEAVAVLNAPASR